MKNLGSALLLGASLSLSACVSQADYNRLQVESDRLNTQYMAQGEELERLRVELYQAKATADIHDETKNVYEEWIAELEEKVKDQDGLKFEVDAVTGEGQLNIANTLLFKPGDIAISDEGLESLKMVSEQLKTAPGILRIDGHTDNQPVQSPRTREHSQDNWQLSVNRSLAVLRTLLNHDVPPEKLSLAAYSQYRPLEENGPSGNAANRRVEIVFIPDRTEDLSEESLPVKSEGTVHSELSSSEEIEITQVKVEVPTEEVETAEEEIGEVSEVDEVESMSETSQETLPEEETTTQSE